MSHSAGTPSSLPRTRNQTMDFFKFVASLVITLMHITFPGDAGKLTITVGSIAAPVFFAITGYYNYNSGRDSVARRIKSILKLYLFAFVATTVLGAVSAGLAGGDVLKFLKDFCLFGREELFQMLLLHYDPRNLQLWYLIAVLFCYLILLLYLDFCGGAAASYRPLYILGGVQFLFFLAFGVLAQPVHWGPPEVFFRSGYFFGGTFFTLGIFLHEYQDRIFQNLRLTPKKLVTLFFIGLFLNCLQAFSIDSGYLTLGALVQIPVLMLLMIACPRMSKAVPTRTLGRLSMYIYVLHMALMRVYDSLIKEPLTARLGSRAGLEPWLAPLIVILLSVAAAVICDLVRQGIRRLRK